MAAENVSSTALVEMLRRELDASKSLTVHLAFLRQLAEAPETKATLRESLLAHIGEEEAEHQAHLARLLPALEAFAAELAAPSSALPRAEAEGEWGFTLGTLIEKRPWHAG